MKMRAPLARVMSLATILLLGVSNRGLAFPEMVRHAYVNCTTCHISPNGGGVLTKYGRSLSEEVLSMWHKEGEGQFAWGAVQPPDWLVPGGDFRELQLFTDSPTARDGRFILMQNDLEAAVQAKGFTVDATLGYLDQKGNVFDHVISRRHYVMYQPTDKIAVRAGRFMRAFGINTPDHAITTKQGLLMDEGMETYNAEVSYIGEKFDAFITGVFGRLGASTISTPAGSVPAEHGVALRSSVALGDSYKVGVSYLYGASDAYTRHAFGPYAILGFTPHLYALLEGDLQSMKATGATETQTGPWTYVRLGYEFFQGIHVYLTHQYQQNKFGDGQGVPTYGGGFMWYPRPHFELMSLVQRSVLPANAGNMDLLAFQMHLYL